MHWDDVKEALYPGHRGRGGRRAPRGRPGCCSAPDLLGTAEQTAEALHAHAAFREVTEVAFALPFSFEDEDYEQMLTDVATRLGPALGWLARTSG
jgi:hypothetical protein